MKPGDIVVWRDKNFGHHRFWEVEGVFYGAEGQESVIELRSMLESPACSYKGTKHPTTFVPEPLLRGAEVFTRSES